MTDRNFNKLCIYSVKILKQWINLDVGFRTHILTYC